MTSLRVQSKMDWMPCGSGYSGTGALANMYLRNLLASKPGNLSRCLLPNPKQGRFYYSY